MQIRYIKINLTKIAMMLFIIKSILDCQHSNLLTMPRIFDMLCIGFGAGVFLLKIVPYRFNMKSFLVFAGSALLILLTCYQTRQYDLLISFITIFLLRDEDLDEYVKLMFNFQILVMIIVFCAMSIAHFGYFEYIYWFRSYERVSFMACMSHPNVFAACIFSILLMYGWLHFETMTTFKYIIMIFITITSFLLTDTRTTFILSILFIGILFFSRNNYLQKWCEKYVKFIFPGLSVIMLLLMKQYTYGHPFILNLDKLLSSRIKLGAYAYNQSGITIFPRPLDYVQSGVVEWQKEWGLNAFTFDNIYSFSWVQLGIVWLIFISVIIYVLSKKTDYKGRFFILMWTIYGFTEVHGLNCFRFFPLLLAAQLFNSTEKVKKSDTIKINRLFK